MVHVWGRTPRASTSDGALSYGASLAGNKRGRLIRRGVRGARVGKLQRASRGSSTAHSRTCERKEAGGPRGVFSGESGEQKRALVVVVRARRVS